MTISGAHTIHELSELLTNLDGFAASMAQSYATGWAAWSAVDPAAADDWKRDYDSFVARWTPASAAAHARINAVGVGDRVGAAVSEGLNPIAQAEAALAWLGGQSSSATWDQVTDEPAYQAVLSAWKPSDGDPTSFDDLDRRWRAQTVAPPPTYTVVQPTAPDADLGAYKAADAGVQAVQAIAAAAKNAAEPWLPSYTELAVAGVVALFALALFVRVAK